MPNEVNIAVKTKGTKQAKKAFKELNTASSSLKKAALGLGAALGARALGRQIGAAVNRAEEMNSAYAITEQILLQTKGAANLTAQEIKDLSKQQSLLTGVDKKLVTEGNNVLLTFKNLRDEAGAGNDVFTRSSASMLDLAAVMKTDAKSAALQLAKALNDPIANLGALGRAGVQFTDQQKEQIKTMAKSGDLLGAQKIILDELESQFGGTAEASADATAKISNAVKEMQEAVGNAILPIVEGLVPAFVKMGEVAPAVISNITLGFGQMRRQFQRLNDSWSEQQEAVFQVNRRMGEYVEKITSGSSHANVFAGALVNLSNKGDAYEGTLKALIETSGISNDSLRDAISILLRGATEYGLSATQVDNLRRELNRLNLAELKGIATTGEATDATEGFAKAVADLRGAQLALVDPLFAAERASDAFTEALAEARKEGGVTASEFEGLVEKFGAMKAAEAGIGLNNISAAAALATEMNEQIGGAAANLPRFLSSLSSFDTSALAATERLIAKLTGLTSKPLDISVRLTAPSQGEIRRSFLTELARLRRDGRISATGF